MRVTSLDFIFHCWRNSRLWFWSFMSNYLFICLFIYFPLDTTMMAFHLWSFQLSFLASVMKVLFARPMRSTPIRRFLSECVCMCVFVWLGNSAKLTYVSFLRRITFWHILIFKLWQVTCVPLRGERFVAAAEERAWPAPKCRPRPQLHSSVMSKPE